MMNTLRVEPTDTIWGGLYLSNGDQVDLDGCTPPEAFSQVICEIVDYGTRDIGDEANVLVVRGKEEWILDTLEEVKQYFLQMG